MWCIEGNKGRNNMVTSPPWVSGSLDEKKIQAHKVQSVLHWSTLSSTAVLWKAHLILFCSPQASPWPDQVSGVPSGVQQHIFAARSVSFVYQFAVWWRHRLSTGQCWASWLLTHCVWPLCTTTSLCGCPTSSVSPTTEQRKSLKFIQDFCNTFYLHSHTEKLKYSFLCLFQTMQSSCSSLCFWLRCFWRCTAWDHDSTSTPPLTALTAASVLYLLLSISQLSTCPYLYAVWESIPLYAQHCTLFFIFPSCERS